VVVGLYPYAYLAQAIGGDRLEVVNLTRPGAEPHDLELTARDTIAVATSLLTIYQAGLQPAVDAAVAQAEPPGVLETTAIVPLVDGDPHIWLDPSLMIRLARAIAWHLSALDPDGAATYSTGLTQLESELTSLDERFTTGLATCLHRGFITTHAAFAYLAARYGLEQIAISGVSPDAEPSPERIARIQQTAVAEGLTTVFFETLAPPDLARAIAGDLGLRTDQLDPVEGLTEQSRGTDYDQIMTANLAALQQANGCR
jgi:zinc transport system substrate-binding protein